MCALKGHDWSGWEYPRSDACMQVRACRRDGITEERLVHRSAQWQYASPDKCDQANICSACGTTLDSRVDHSFGDWHVSAESVCHQARVCGRCNLEESRTDHAMEDLGENEVTRMLGNIPLQVLEVTLRCSKCGEESKHIVGAV